MVASCRVGINSQPGVVGDGVELASGSDFKDFSVVVFVVVICHVRCGVGDGEAGVGIGVAGDLEIVYCA